MKLYRYKIYENDFKVEVQSVVSVAETGDFDKRKSGILNYEKGLGSTFWVNLIIKTDYGYAFDMLKEISIREIGIVRNMIGRTT